MIVSGQQNIRSATPDIYAFRVNTMEPGYKESMRRNIAVLTTSRADFSHLQWPLRRMQEHRDLQIQIIAMGAHLSEEFGHSINEIESADFTADHIIECLLSSDTDIGMAKTIGVATLGLADLLGRIRPDILLLTADRYEMLAPAATALALRIPLAHIEGGEISEGAIDDAVRNAITKMAHLHFTPTEAARQRVMAMGEEAWRVHAVGAPSIDTLFNSALLDRNQLQQVLGVVLEDSFFLVAIHPVTLLDDTLAETDETFSAITQLSEQVLFCFPNSDAGSRRLIRRAQDFCSVRGDAHVFVNLAPDLYWSLLAQCTALVGNSSSGIMETPALEVPTVNVGIRQLGRQRAKNIIDVDARAEAIVRAMQRAGSQDFRASLENMSNPYGDGHSGERIAQLLAAAPERKKLLHKRALELSVATSNQLAFQQHTDSKT